MGENEGEERQYLHDREIRRKMKKIEASTIKRLQRISSQFIYLFIFIFILALKLVSERKRAPRGDNKKERKGRKRTSKESKEKVGLTASTGRFCR